MLRRYHYGNLVMNSFCIATVCCLQWKTVFAAGKSRAPDVPDISFCNFSEQRENLL
jgi:hypothetical protein